MNGETKTLYRIEVLLTPEEVMVLGYIMGKAIGQYSDVVGPDTAKALAMKFVEATYKSPNPVEQVSNAKDS